MTNWPAIEPMKRALPYGLWIEEGGAVIVFNRRYRPIARIGSRAEGGVRSRMRGDEWVEFTYQAWAYKDVNPPWRSSATRRRVESVLRGFGIDPREAMAEARADIAAERSRRRRA